RERDRNTDVSPADLGVSDRLVPGAGRIYLPNNSAGPSLKCPQVFVAKPNPASSGTQPLDYATYLGGTNNDSAGGIALDSKGNVYVTGSTSSQDFPTVNPLEATLAGNMDAFVTELNAAGSSLLFSTYLGGTYNNAGAGIV